MKKILISDFIEQKESAYPIYIGQNLLTTIASLIEIEKYSSIFILTDDTVKSFYLSSTLASLPDWTTWYSLPPGESQKTSQTLITIWTQMQKANCDRKSLVINLGGGVIGDIGGFGAATYMRGVAFINIPTTLLSMVDESIGGKTGIDEAGVKNLVGVFKNPTAVIIDTNTLTTLPKKEILSGFSEIIKTGLIRDKAFFDLVTSKEPLQFSPLQMADIIETACRIKSDIILQDPTEQNRRKILNFGHTTGHAIEILSLGTKSQLPHGQAVALGMLIESTIANHLNLLSRNDLNTIVSAIKNAGFPMQLPPIPNDEIIKKMKTDKKNEKGVINMTLLTGIGQAVYNKTVPPETILAALSEVNKKAT
jgi:3-dehydroquinate synthase